MAVKKGNIKVAAIGIAVLVIVVFGGLFLTQNIGRDERELTEEAAVANVSDMAAKVKPQMGTPMKSALEYSEEETTAEELPDIDTRPVTADETTETFVEIFAAPNLADTGSDAWLSDMAREFNNAGVQVDGKPVSVRVRNVTGGQALDYIASGKYVPDALCTSNDLWVSMLNARGVKTDSVRESLVRDVAGILLDQEHYDELIGEYGTIDMKAITEAVANEELSFGYTNPFTSSTGLNFLVSTLLRYDSSNPLSADAAKGFQDFQANVPMVSLTTQQMVKASRSGTLDGFVNEYQVYSKDSTLQSAYQFVPFGYRHDYPLVMVNEDAIARKIVEEFANYCDEHGGELATADGFNGMDDYVCEQGPLDGGTLIAAEKFYKENKDADPVVCVFVADVSGSMAGEPLSELKKSLVNGMKYINEDNYIGLVSYDDRVTIELPIAGFDMNQQTLFKGTVEHLDTGGNTATFDAVVVAADLIRQQLESTPNAKPMIFVLSDGETNRGYSLKEVTPVLQGLKYPVYTIGYNADITALESIADINEAASINASTDDVVYQLKTLFNANM